MTHDQRHESVRVLVLGAHPDDAEFHAGGLLTLHRRRGNAVKIVSVTNGAAGHHQLSPRELEQTRRGEARQVAQILGAEYEVWDFPDGELMPTLEVRRRVIAEIRSFRPDLVLTHRTCDYHPDHRAVGQVVQDASFMVTVPLIVPDVPAIRRDPVVAYMNDLFTRPAPFRADVLLDISQLIDEIVALLDCHGSQMYQWLPYVQSLTDPVPSDPAARLAWLRTWFAHRPASLAQRFRPELVASLGQTRGNSVGFVEAYEISEYAGRMSDADRDRLFPQGVTIKHET